MNFKEEPDQFVDVLMHEICHVLLTDNNKHQSNKADSRINLLEVWSKLFGKDKDFNVLAHIPVHAISKHIYLDILKEPSRLERDKKSVEDWQGSKSYKDSWAYVEKIGYKKIISQLKSSYDNLAKQ